MLRTEIEGFVDATTAAEFLSVTRRRVLEMARASAIPAHPIGRAKRRTWRFRLSELAQAVVTNEGETGPRKHVIIDAGGPLAVPTRKGL